jgi:uncharacterized protein YabE (DUF348 family)/3D (Asp-Asp-Asp) domain-containing protein
VVRLPGGPASYLKIRYISVIAVIVAAGLTSSTLTGFAWADQSVTVVVDGVTRVLQTQAPDVSSLLSQAGIDVSGADFVSAPLSRTVNDGDTIVVRHAIPVTVHLGEGAVSLSVLGKTVGDALVVAGLDPTSGMHTSPAIDAPLVDGMDIKVTDVFLRIEQAEAEVPFDVVVTNDPKLRQGERKVVRQGSAGRALKVYEVLVVGGEEGQRTLTAQKVLKPAVDEMVVVGSKEPIHQVVRRGVRKTAPQPPKTGKAFFVLSTAYTPWDAGCGGIGAISHRVKHYRIPQGWGIIAVDPKVIPIGSKVWVAGYGYAVACDTGGAIKGMKIDVCYWGADLYATTAKWVDGDNGVKRAARAASHRWGVRKHVKVIILSKP